MIDYAIAKCCTVLPRLSVPRSSENSIFRTQFRTWSLFEKIWYFSLISQTSRLSRVHVFVCHTYMFNVGTQWYVIVYSVKCKGLQTRPSYIFLCYSSMYIARIWIIRTSPLIRTAYKTSLPKGVRITGVGLYHFYSKQHRWKIELRIFQAMLYHIPLHAPYIHIHMYMNVHAPYMYMTSRMYVYV